MALPETDGARLSIWRSDITKTEKQYKPENTTVRAGHVYGGATGNEYQLKFKAQS